MVDRHEYLFEILTYILTKYLQVLYMHRYHSKQFMAPPPSLIHKFAPSDSINRLEPVNLART